METFLHRLRVKNDALVLSSPTAGEVSDLKFPVSGRHKLIITLAPLCTCFFLSQEDIIFKIIGTSSYTS